MTNLFKSWVAKSAGLALFGLLASCSNMTELSSNAPLGLLQKKTEKGLPSEPSPEVVAKAATIKGQDKHGYKTYSDKVRTRLVRTTSYSHMEREVGAPGRKNCLGGTLKYGEQVRSVAADWSVYPVGTKFRIKGLPYIYVVDDFGSALVGTNTIDIFHPSLSLMRKWGSRPCEVTIVQWGDYDRSLRLLSKRRRYKHCNKMYVQLQGRISRNEVAKSETTAEEISQL